MVDENTIRLVNDSFEAYKNGDADKARESLRAALFGGDVMTFRAWWLTETNPEYRMVSEGFLKFVADYCKSIVGPGVNGMAEQPF